MMKVKIWGLSVVSRPWSVVGTGAGYVSGALLPPCGTATNWIGLSRQKAWRAEPSMTRCFGLYRFASPGPTQVVDFPRI